MALVLGALALNSSLAHLYHQGGGRRVIYVGLPFMRCSGHKNCYSQNMPGPKQEFVRAPLIGATILLVAGACTSVPVGGSGSPGSLSVISGDLRLRFNSPVNVYLRKVDDTRLGIFKNRVRVSPGSHVLLVDCAVEDAGGTSRYVLNVTTVAGVDYQLQAVLASGNRSCSAVEMVETPR